MADNPLPGDEGMPDNVRSISERAEEGEGEQQAFPKGVIDAGSSRKTLKNLIQPGVPVELEVSMMSAAIPLRGGIPDPDAQHRFIVTTELHKVEPVVKREEGQVVSWKLRAHLRPVYVEAVSATAASDSAS